MSDPSRAATAAQFQHTFTELLRRFDELVARSGLGAPPIPEADIRALLALDARCEVLAGMLGLPPLPPRPSQSLGWGRLPSHRTNFGLRLQNLPSWRLEAERLLAIAQALAEAQPPEPQGGQGTDRAPLTPSSDVEVRAPAASATEPRAGNGTLTFEPGAFVYRGHREPLYGKPLEVLQAIAEAQGNTLTLAALRDKVWPDACIGDETIRSAVKKARKAIRKAMAAVNVEGPADPLQAVDRGQHRTAWRLTIP